MYNRIDATLSDSDMADIRKAVEVILAKLPFRASETPNEKKKTGWSLSLNARVLATRALMYGRLNTNCLSANVKLNDLERDLDLMEKLRTVGTLIGSMSGHVDGTYTILQKESVKQGLIIYKQLQIAVNAGECTPDVIENMKVLMPRTGKKNKGKETSTES